MNRPNHLNCIMTPEIIRAINEEQRIYDEGSDAYEKAEQLKAEEYQREQQELADDFVEQEQRAAEQEYQNQQAEEEYERQQNEQKTT